MLGIIDNLTKYLHIVPVKDVSARVTSKRVHEFVEKFGAPNRMITDRGTSFTSQSFKDLCEKFGIKHTLNSSRHPQANGLIERMNQTILPAMRSATVSEEQNDWDKGLAKLERDVNATVSKTTGKTPYETLYGYVPRFDDGRAREVSGNCETYRLPEVIQEEVRDSILREQEKYKKRYDKNRFKNVKYELGDIVFVKRNPTATGQSTKLQAVYGGPMVIVGILPGDTYRIKKLNESRDRGFVTTAHVSQLKIWKRSEDRQSESESESGSESENETDDGASEKNDSSNAQKSRKTNVKEEAKGQERNRRMRNVPVRLRDYDCS